MEAAVEGPDRGGGRGEVREGTAEGEDGVAEEVKAEPARGGEGIGGIGEKRRSGRWRENQQREGEEEGRRRER